MGQAGAEPVRKTVRSVLDDLTAYDAFIKTVKYSTMLILNMNQCDNDLESMIVSTEWEDKDNDIVVQAFMDEETGFKNKPDLD